MSGAEEEAVGRATGKDKHSMLPAIDAATRASIIAIAVLSIPLTAASALGLTAAQTSAWILAFYGLTGLLSIALIARYRQPLLVTGNIFVILFISRLGLTFSYPELIGASIVAGGLVLLVGLLGLTQKLAALVPLPVVFGLLAGAVLSFVTGIFNQVAVDPIVAGGTFVAYVLSLLLLGRRLPAVLPALVVGLSLTAVTGQFGTAGGHLALRAPQLTTPVFSLRAIVAAAPIFVVLTTLQANLPSVRYLQSQGYQPPERMITTVGGAATILASLLGPLGMSLSLPITSLIGGPEAGAREVRHRAAYIASAAGLLIGGLASMAAALVSLVPVPLLLTLAGIALIRVLGSALQQATQGPLLLGPLLAFAIAVSNVTFLGIGDTFWALVVGTAISWLLERDGMRALRAAEATDACPAELEIC